MPDQDLHVVDMSSLRRQRELEKEKAAERKEFGAAHVDDTTRDNASPTKAKSPVGYIEDAQIRTEDKCRYTGDLRVRVEAVKTGP